MKNIYLQRRQKLMGRLGDGILVLAGAGLKLRNGDNDFPFRQGSDFFYLTGFDEPDSYLILSQKADLLESVLLVPERDKEKEIWNGSRIGTQGAVEIFGFDQAFPNTELERVMLEKLSGHKTLFYDFFSEPAMDQIVLETLKKLKAQIAKRKNPEFPRQIIMYAEELAAMRQLKDKTELKHIERAVSITAEALAEVQKNLRPGMTEVEIKALIEYIYVKNGGTPGFGTIVAAGYNSTCLHYSGGGAVLQATDLLLIDTGCEYKFITSDVTRCYPVSGVFTDKQRIVYEIVLAANKAAIELCVPGSNIIVVNDAARRVCAEGLIKMGLFVGTVEELMADKLLDKFFVHKTSHWLGMDAHDAGLYEKDGKPLPFAPGMILTVEPGLYFRKEYSGIDTEFEGIGIRIEDDILITDTAYRVLTENIPKELSQLESGMVK